MSHEIKKVKLIKLSYQAVTWYLGVFDARNLKIHGVMNIWLYWEVIWFQKNWFQKDRKIILNGYQEFFDVSLCLDILEQVQIIQGALKDSL